MNKIEVLQKAKELISNPDRWTQGSPARDIDGGEVEPDDSNAHTFCILGAISKACGFSDSISIILSLCDSDEIMKLLYEKDSDYISMFNDNENTTHEDVMKFFDIAIKEAEKEVE